MNSSGKRLYDKVWQSMYNKLPHKILTQQNKIIRKFMVNQIGNDSWNNFKTRLNFNTFLSTFWRLSTITEGDKQ